MNEISHLLALADAYLAVTHLKEVTLSHRLFGDSKKLTAMRDGADITVSRFNAAVAWFISNWPEGADWPDGIPLSPEAFDAMFPGRAPTAGEVA